MEIRNFSTTILIVLLAIKPVVIHAQETNTTKLINGAFIIGWERYGISELWRTGDVHATNYVRKGRHLGDVNIRYQTDRGIDSLKASTSSVSTILKNGQLQKKSDAAVSEGPVRFTQSFDLLDQSIQWKLTLHNNSEKPVSILDLALPLFYNSGGGENPKQIFEERVIKHHFISGNNSFIYFQRPTGLGPYLVMVPQQGTSLEYFSTTSPGEQRGTFQAFIHSAYTGNKETRGTWRQQHSSKIIAPGSTVQYGFTFRWAKDYQGIRNILFEEGLIDVQSMPGMTVPSDLETRIALRTKQKISAVLAEFPSATNIQYIGQKQPGTYLYKIKFNRLGENKLTVNYGNGFKTYLEFFVTEPLETLYKKRSAFIVNSQQHKVPSKWYDGLFGIYDMKNAVLRGPDNADYFDTSRLSYVLTCDDPGLCKAPFVAAKNVYYPSQKEIDAIEYYIEHFVWGGLQRTDKELPYPYGVYGTPNWLVNRDTAARLRNLKDVNREKMHVWRSYDYPHIMMMYYHMYQIASMYPGMTHYLDKKGYLERARETAKAYFKYPYEILPWYETYKWGCYNELLIPALVADLKKEGFPEDAAFLTAEWEKKVKYFIYDDPYPFRSEYAIDATAFESSHALAKYAVENKMQPDSNLWFDKNLKRWYSHPVIKDQDAAKFMDRQTQANIALRGWIEPAYYYSGSDFRGKSDSYTLSYMSQMGGWSILDYALNYSSDPADYIRLGYQSYLSSFALINSGTASSNYGFWYPGKQNDGAAGWAFEPQKFATPWIQKQQGRGPWYYDGEIDLGFGGATRMAATIATNDPIFGMVAYGGSMETPDNVLKVVPKDGIRRRFYVRNGKDKFDIVLDRDGFAVNRQIIVGPTGKSLEFVIENRSNDQHTTKISLKGFTGNYLVSTGSGKLFIVKLLKEGSELELPISKSTTTVLVKKN